MFVKCGLELANRDAVPSKEVWRQTDERLYAPGAVDDLACVALGDELTRSAAYRLRPRRSPDLVGLSVGVFVAVAMRQRAETKLESDVFDKVPIHIEAKRVKPLVPERFGSGQSRVRIYGHRHNRPARTAREQIIVVHVEARIVFGVWIVEMMRHLSSLIDGSASGDGGREKGEFIGGEEGDAM